MSRSRRNTRIVHTISVPVYVVEQTIPHSTIVFFKRLGSRHIDKEIELQEGMKGIDNILCKTNLNLIRGLTYNTYNEVLFEIGTGN